MAHFIGVQVAQYNRILVESLEELINPIEGGEPA
jgi:hypothetical protein